MENSESEGPCEIWVTSIFEKDSRVKTFISLEFSPSRSRSQVNCMLSSTERVKPSGTETVRVTSPCSSWKVKNDVEIAVICALVDTCRRLSVTRTPCPDPTLSASFVDWVMEEEMGQLNEHLYVLVFLVQTTSVGST